MSNWSRKGLYWKEMGAQGTDQKQEDQRKENKEALQMQVFIFSKQEVSVHCCGSVLDLASLQLLSSWPS